MSNYRNSVVIGIDVGSEFSIAGGFDQNRNRILFNYRIDHNGNSFAKFIAKLNEISKEHGQVPVIGVEATGTYHMPLQMFLEHNNFDVKVINPLVSNSTKNINIRKVKCDKNDALKIAKLFDDPDTKFSQVLSKDILELRYLIRNFYSITDDRAKLKIRLSTLLVSHWPGFNSIFSDTCSIASFNILSRYPTPKTFIDGDKSSIIEILLKSRQGLTWATNKYNLLLDISKTALITSAGIKQEFLIHSCMELIKNYDNQISAVLNQIDNFIEDHKDSQFVKNINLVDSLPGCGRISAVAVTAEMGDFELFHKPKQLIAFFGLDPEVNESGKFKGTELHISKRGSSIARRALFSIALSSVGTKDGAPINPEIRKYYEKKCTSKPKMVALTNVMHKTVKFIFSVLKNQKKFEIRSKEEHINFFLQSQAA